MEYQFDNYFKVSDRIIFAIILDKRKMKERVLVGTDYGVQRRLRGEKHCDVYCDITRSLGSLMLNFTYDSEKQWNSDAIMELKDALHSKGKMKSLHESKASNFLSEQYKSGIPEKMFAAVKLWNGYLLLKDTKPKEIYVDAFLGDIEKLVNVFHRERLFRIDFKKGFAKDYELSNHFYYNLSPREQTIEIWYPDRSMKLECALVEKSFYPLVIYYLNKLNEWGLCFRQCKVCGKIFIAENNKFNLCSDKCKKAQAVVNKIKFEMNAKSNEYDRLYKNECERWRNKINSTNTIKSLSETEIQHLKEAFLEFKEMAKKKRKLVIADKMTSKEYINWIYKNGVDSFK